MPVSTVLIQLSLIALGETLDEEVERWNQVGTGDTVWKYIQYFFSVGTFPLLGT